MTSGGGVTRDYNGPDEWSLSGVVERYRAARCSMGLEPKPIEPRIHTEGDTTWIYPAMDWVIDRANSGDRPALELCLQLIETDISMPFGMILKSRAARALKKSASLISETQRRRIIDRIADMEARGYRPREYREYVKIRNRIQWSTGQSETAR